MDQFDFFNIPSTGLFSITVAVAAFLGLLLIYYFRVNSVVSARRESDLSEARKEPSDYLPATVVVYSQADAEVLSEMLPVLLNQDYPAAYEIVVVNEGESADVRDAVSMLRMSNPNLYLTFTPDGVRSLSRKKLALTLGVKAARYDVLVMITTASVIMSKDWLRGMMSKFSAGSKVDVVLGYAMPLPGEDEAFGHRCRAFDYTADSVRWLAPALAGHPFRGTEYNLAYRKSLFLKNNGFARSLNLHYGDDDIFISEIANGGNTAVELSEDSIVGIRRGNTPRVFRERVIRHCFTEGFVKRRPKLLMPLTSWLQWIVLVGAVYSSVVASHSYVALSVAAALVVLTVSADMFFWRRAMKALKMRPLALTLPYYSMTYSIRRLFRKLRSRFTHQRKYTWT